jgi:hypothetical protein
MSGCWNGWVWRGGAIPRLRDRPVAAQTRLYTKLAAHPVGREIFHRRVIPR